MSAWPCCGEYNDHSPDCITIRYEKAQAIIRVMNGVLTSIAATQIVNADTDGYWNGLEKWEIVQVTVEDTRLAREALAQAKALEEK